MPSASFPIIRLAEFVDGREADCFVLISRIEEAKTREGKLYFRVSLRDGSRELTFPLWADSPWFEAAKNEWHAGLFLKVRGIYRDTQFGPQLDLRKVREANDEDKSDGFDRLMCLPCTRYNVVAMFEELLGIVRDKIHSEKIRALVEGLLLEHRDVISDLPAAVRHHHAFRGGFLEHVLSVTKNAVFLAEKYVATYPELQPPLSIDLIVAGAVLHDIGKLVELRAGPAGAEFTPEGELIGHIVLGRDVVREAATKHELDRETRLRLEHIVLAHQKTAEWGSPKPPMTPEALLVYYADDIDAKLQMMVEALAQPTTGFMTSRKNALDQKVFRGLSEA